MSEGKVSARITRSKLESILKEQRQNFQNQELGVKREILKEVEKQLPSDQVVVVNGLRRVGKSTLLKQLAEFGLKNDYYFVNFEDERLLNFEVKNFDLLHEVLMSLYGEKKVFLLDEIQNVTQWERFVRRMMDQGYKFVVTGSNASLLSQELGDRLTGRHLDVEVFPFSFREYLDFLDMEIPELDVFTTKEKAKRVRLTTDYLRKGGIPDALKYPDLKIHKTLYDDVLYRDIASRYKIENVKSLQELALYLASNFSCLTSFNKLKQLLKLGSVNTVKKYFQYLENSWLFFVINKYAYSVKEQQIAPKKVYGIDNGLLNSVGFSFSENKGRFLENQVFLYLRKKFQSVYYYKTETKHEVDFYVPEANSLWQVTESLDDEDVRKREFRALVEAKEELKDVKNLFVVTLNKSAEADYSGSQIKLVPLYQLLLSG